MKHTRKNKQRKPYTGSKAADSSCRSHGGCPYCLRNRMHGYKRPIQVLEDEVGNEFMDWEPDPWHDDWWDPNELADLEGQDFMEEVADWVEDPAPGHIKDFIQRHGRPPWSHLPLSLDFADYCDGWGLEDYWQYNREAMSRDETLRLMVEAVDWERRMGA